MSAPSQPLAEPVSAQPTTQPTSSGARKRGGMFSPLKYRDYRLLFAGQLISYLGDAFYSVALPWYMLTDGGGVANLGLVMTAYGVPMGASTLFGGWLSDKLRPRRVMLFSDFIRTFILAGLAWLTFGGGAPFVNGVPLWAIAAFTATLGLFDGIFLPASNAVTPDLLPDEQLQAANGLFFSLGRLAQMVGPAVAGAAVASLGSPLSFAIDAGTFAMSTLTLAFIRGRVTRPSATAHDQPTSEGEAGETGDATAAVEYTSLWRFAFATPYFLILLLVMIISNMINGVAEIALPAMAHGPLHGDAQGFGFMIAAFGAGGLAGGLLASALGSRVNRGLISLSFYGMQTGAFFALAFAPTMLAAILCLGAFGLFNGLGNVTFMTLIQRKLPRNLLGRIMGVFAFTNFAMFPLSVAASGFAVARYGPEPVIIAGAGLLFGALFIALLSRDLRNL
ncbi:MAG TPA: MFS transporter [Ktedonobacterales bacterium]|nr:MFS transporter [Ktedonobacterales bacterium]